MLTSALILWLTLGLVVTTLAIAKADEPGPLIDGEHYNVYGSTWPHLCLTWATPDDDLVPLIEQAFALWYPHSPLQSCGRVAIGTEDIFFRYSDVLGLSILGLAGQDGGDRTTIGHIYIYINRQHGNFLGVVAHELGHGFGIGHSFVPNQLMSSRCCNPLGPDDIAAIQHVYGPRTSGFTPTPTMSSTPGPIYRYFVPGLVRD